MRLEEKQKCISKNFQQKHVYSTECVQDVQCVSVGTSTETHWGVHPGGHQESDSKKKQLASGRYRIAIEKSDGICRVYEHLRRALFHQLISRVGYASQRIGAGRSDRIRFSWEVLGFKSKCWLSQLYSHAPIIY